MLSDEMREELVQGLTDIFGNNISVMLSPDSELEQDTVSDYVGLIQNWVGRIIQSIGKWF